MATAGEGGATTNMDAIASSYDGGGGEGVGGKFRKRPFRRAHHTTPYDRPLTALRGITAAATNNNNSSWLNKLVVDPASKLISYGAHRIFASVFRKRLPPPPQPPEANNESSDGLQEVIPNSRSSTKETAGGNSSHPVNRFNIGGISELEELLKQKTFSRSEIERLTELLRSRAEELPVGKRTQESLPELASDLGRHHPLEEDRNDRDIYHGVNTTISNSRVLGDDIASPAELAKAYMGSGPSKISPSKLGMGSQICREDARLLSNVPFTPKSPVMSSITRSAVNVGVPVNGFITPRSRGRSAIYNMARTPYPKVNRTAINKGSGSTNNGHGRSSLSTSRSLLEHDVSKQVSLKRRSSILDDDLGASDIMRRVRPKPNLLSPRIPHSAGGVGIGFDGVRGSLKQRLPLADEPKHTLSITVRKNEDDSIPSTSYDHVPSKSTEMASRILQHLEKLSPKEKSSDPQLVASREKTPDKSTPNMLHGQDLRSLEYIVSSKLLQEIRDGHNLEDQPIVTLHDAHDFTSHKKGTVEPRGQKDFAIPHNKSTLATNNDTTGLSKASGPSVEAFDAVSKSFVAQPPQRNQAFRMSAQEDSFELDDDIHCNGVEPKPFSEERVTSETSLSKPSPTEELKLDQTTSLSEEKSVPDPISSKRSDVGSDAVFQGELSTGSAFSSLHATSTASESVVLSQLVSAADKQKEANDSHPLFSFSSKTVDEVPLSAFSSSPSESSSKRPFTWSESKPENSSSLVNVVSAATGAQLPVFCSDKGGHPNSLISSDTNGKSETAFPVTLNGPRSSSPAFSSTAATTSDANHIPIGSSSLFTSSTSIANFGTTGSTSTLATYTSSTFGSTVAPSFSAVPAFKFGSSVDPSPAAVSPASASTILESKDTGKKAERDSNFGSSSNSNSIMTSIMAASSSFQLGSSVSSTANILSQGSLSGSGSGSLVSGTVTQNMPISFGSPLPSSSITNNTPFASSSANSQVPSTNVNFGFSSAASSSESNAVGPGSGPTASIFNFGVSSAASSDGAISSSSGTAPGIFSFGFSSSSSSTNVVGSTIGATPTVFSFGSSSAASTSGVNAASSFGSGTSGIFNFGSSSPASSSAANLVSSSNSTTNLFGSSWQSPNSPILGSTFTSPSPSTGFAFGAASSPFAATNTAPIVFSSSAGPSSIPIFSFTTASAAVLSSPSLSHTQPVFGNPPAFAALSGNDQMNAEDSMAEDTMQSSAPSVPLFGQPTVSPSPPGFMFGPTVPSQPNPFQFAGQQNQVALHNPSPFQASTSLEFNAGGSFSLGSGGGGGDKSGRKYVKANRSKSRKK